MKKWISKNNAILIFVVVALFTTIFLGAGSPFKYDWSWPFFNMKLFWDGLIGDSLQGIFSALSKNGPAIFGLFGLIHFPSSIFLKIFIFLVHFTAGYGFYRFIRSRVKSEAIAIISGLAYAFTPYIFIRTIVGFAWSMVAYAVLPIFLLKFWQDKKKIIDYLIIGFLLSLIFTQNQTGLLTVLIMSVYTAVKLFRPDRKKVVKDYLLSFFSLLIISLPWAIVMMFHKTNLSVVSGGAVTTLNFIASLPHSFRNFFMSSDHHITAGFFYPLSHDKYFFLGWGIVWFVAFCAIFNKKNRELVLTFIISCLIVLPFIKGPLGVFGKFYIWFYNHFLQIAVFRETYHFEFLYAISLCVLFAFGLDWLWGKISSQQVSKSASRQTTNLLKTGLKTLFAGSALFIIAPYLTFDFAGYLKLQKIPQEYSQLDSYFETNKDYCKKIYYPPGLGFVYFKNDKTQGASNSDTLASSIGISYLTDGTSVLNLPSDEMFYRNELVSQFYEKQDDGKFAGLLNEDDIDCVVLRLDTETKYDQASNLWREKDPTVRKKWNQTDLKALVESKQGMKLDKQFGENILIYKVDTTTKIQIDRNYEITNKTGNSAIQQFSNSAIVSLRLTDWANNYAYYKDGWSRGRYDFWRKHLFTQLRQDFIYTDKLDSVLTGKVDKTGDYEVWVRYLTGGKPGEIELSVSAGASPDGRITNYELRVQKDPGDEKFVWKKVGDIKLDGKTDVEIKNISGENAIADLILLSR